MKKLYVGKTIGENYVINPKPGTGLVSSVSVTYPTLDQFIDAIELQSRSRKVIVEIVAPSRPDDVAEISKRIIRSSTKIEDILYRNSSQLKKRKTA